MHVTDFTLQRSHSHAFLEVWLFTLVLQIVV